MRLTDKEIVERIKAGEVVKVRRAGGLVELSFTADTYSEILGIVGALRHKDWEVVE